MITTFSVGGAERHLLELVKEMVEKGLDVEVAFFKEEAQEAPSLLPDFRGLGVTVTDLGMRRGWSLRPLWRLSSLIRRFAPDVVHTHLYRADIAGIALGRLHRVPVTVSSVHNLDLEQNYPRWRRLVIGAYKRADRIVAISHAVRRELCSGYGLDPDRVITIHYGIQPTGIAEPRAPFRDAPAIGTVGRLARQKAHDVLIEAFARVLERFPTSTLHIVGHDDEGLRPALEEQARKMGISGSVHVEGFKKDIQQVLTDMDLFVLSSDFEGFGLVLLEAMAAQLPIVATAVGPIPEIIEDGVSGRLVPPRDPGALAAAIVACLEDPGGASEMGRRGRARVGSEFTVEEMVVRTIELYETLLHPDRASP
ncbi:MAG: glycosyltransferase [Actinomycetota bacterium]